VLLPFLPLRLRDCLASMTVVSIMLIEPRVLFFEFGIRQLLNTENLLEALLEQINHHLEQNSIIVSLGSINIIDTTVIEANVFLVSISTISINFTTDFYLILVLVLIDTKQFVKLL
jgi:hypothetical protein